VRDMLVNQLYVGVLVFGATQTVRRKGKKARIPQTDSAKIVRAERPEWRIVPEALWKAAQERKRQTFETYLRGADGRLSGKPEAGVLESKYLLSGLLECGECGGKLVIWSHRGREPRYVCSTHRGRGHAGCTNNASVRAKFLDDFVVYGLRKRILTRERLDALAKNMAEQAAGSPAKVAAQRNALEAELRKSTGRLEKLVAAVAAGGPVESLVAAIRAEERTSETIRGQLAQLEAARKSAEEWGSPVYVDKVNRLLRGWHAALAGNVAVARQAIRKIITSPIYVRNISTVPDKKVWTVGAKGLFGPLTDPLGVPIPLSDRPEPALAEELAALVASMDVLEGGIAGGTPDAPGAPSSPGCRGRRTGPHPTWS
jgi:hypothetical protein